MYSPLRIDIGVRDLLAGWGATWLPAAWLERRLARPDRWQPPPDALVLLSVRSGLDLLLSTLALPAGSEVLLSAVTIADMGRVVEAHGLVPVAVDIDPATLLPDPRQLAERVGPRSRALIVAHLFGSYNDLAESAAFCRRHGLLLVEDCAQCFTGPGSQGSPQAAVSLFSFGPIKRATALGGAVAYVRDAALRAGMAERLAALPVQAAGAYRARLAKYLGLALLARPWLYGVLLWALARLGRGPEAVLRQAVRGFSAAELLPALRRRPCAALRWMLQRRLTLFDAARLARHVARWEALAQALPVAQRPPGWQAAARSHWVFPVRAADPAALLARLRAHGLHATQAASSLSALGTPEDVPRAVELLRALVYVPCYEGIPAGLPERLLREPPQAGAAP